MDTRELIIKAAAIEISGRRYPVLEGETSPRNFVKLEWIGVFGDHCIGNFDAIGLQLSIFTRGIVFRSITVPYQDIIIIK